MQPSVADVEECKAVGAVRKVFRKMLLLTEGGRGGMGNRGKE